MTLMVKGVYSANNCTEFFLYSNKVKEEIQCQRKVFEQIILRQRLHHKK